MATNDEIIEKYRELVISKDDGDEVEAIVNWNREFALNEARTDERQRIIKILNDLWEKEGKNIDSGVYAYPFEALRDMIIKEIARRAIK